MHGTAAGEPRQAAIDANWQHLCTALLLRPPAHAPPRCHRHRTCPASSMMHTSKVRSRSTAWPTPKQVAPNLGGGGGGAGRAAVGAGRHPHAGSKHRPLPQVAALALPERQQPSCPAGALQPRGAPRARSRRGVPTRGCRAAGSARRPASRGARPGARPPRGPAAGRACPRWPASTGCCPRRCRVGWKGVRGGGGPVGQGQREATTSRGGRQGSPQRRSPAARPPQPPGAQPPGPRLLV